MFNYWERDNDENDEAWIMPRIGFRNETNYATRDREALEADFGKVYDTKELMAEFEVRSFSAPFVCVTRRKDNVRGSICFQNNPRFYWGFEPYPVIGEPKDVGVSLPKLEEQESVQGCDQGRAADNSR